MTKLIEKALNEIKRSWPEAEVTTNEDADGNVDVLVSPVPIGDQYEPETTWIGFRLATAYPDPDVYPHFMGRVQRKDGQKLGESFSDCKWQDREAIQISRRTANWNGATDTAEGKLIKVLSWIRSRK